jgi:tetratricopeptide (TPR) repeat protein
VAAEHSHPHNMAARSGLAHSLRAATEVELACRLHASARRTLDRLGRTDQRYVRVLENLAGCHATMGDYERAGAVYRELLALRPDVARVHFEIAVLHLHTFGLDDAEASFRRAVALDPKLDDAHRALALMPTLRAELAALPTDQARRDDPVRWARVLLTLGRVPDATKAWLAIVLDPATSPSDAFNGLEYLMIDADTPTVRRAIEAHALRNPVDLKFQNALLARRIARQKKVDALRPRIEALAAE